jgi:D-alanine-D-alanine ligase
MRIAVLMGGMSPERDVSLRSGRAVAEGLRSRAHEVKVIDVFDADGDRWRAYSRALENRDVCDAEVVFLALHGDEGEDGTVQAFLETLGKPYTGSGVLASALAMDKIMSKRIFDFGGIPNPEWAVVEPLDGEPVAAAQAERVGGWPVVVKPVDQGSTVGISIVRAPGDLRSALALARSYSGRVLLERYVAGRELTVAVLGEEPLPLVEIVPEGGFYDYECKYTKGKSRYVCPAELGAEDTRGIQDLSLRAYRLLGCEGFARVDLRLSESGKPYFLEINTIPGMTELSLVPMAARAAGIEFPELVDRIARMAVEKEGIRKAVS